MSAQPTFEWDPQKNRDNIEKHKLSFDVAQYAFMDPMRVIAIDRKHSSNKEKRYFCYGKVHGSIVTLRFTWRNGIIRLYGAGYWREGRNIYHEKNSL
jgi:uncharacterized DUF497 family protein